MFKLDLALILAAVVGGAFVIEQGHHRVIDAPAAAEAVTLSAPAACPENDTVPYSAACLEFLKVPGEPAARVQVTMRKEPVDPAPCPDND